MMNKIGKILFVLFIIVFLIFIGFAIKILYDLNMYNNCFIKPYDESFDYNVCIKYVDY